MMLVIAAVMLCCVACSALSEERGYIYGNVYFSPSRIDLESNVTFYTVGCELESTGWGIDSRFLSLYHKTAKVESQIVNDTTIEQKVDLQHSKESEVCGKKTYTCKLNQTVVHSATILIGKAPPINDLTDFRCISENRDYLVCTFPHSECMESVSTKYKLEMIKHHESSNCMLEKLSDKTIKFDSQSGWCPFSARDRSFTFELKASNVFGKTETEIHLNHYDFVRPAAPRVLEVLNISCTSLDVAWNLNSKLINLERQLEFKISLVSDYEDKTTSTNRSFEANERLYHHLHGLTPYTQYKLSIQARVVPMKPRVSESDYWSQWASTTFRTKACRPTKAPVTVPGAYSMREITGNFATVDVFWLKIPHHLQNGSSFKYNVSATDKSGQRHLPSVVRNETATFQQLKIGYYRVEVSCYNEKGPANDINVIEIFPPEENLKPTIKRALWDDGNQLSWYPVPDLHNLLNYTIVYCRFTATGTCRDGIQFENVSASETVFHVSSKDVLNFAVAAIYRNYSSDLSWRQCVVYGDQRPGQPKFSITDISVDSFIIRMNDTCVDRSLVQRYEISVRDEVENTLVRNISFYPHIPVVSVKGLSSDTDYKVLVMASHDSASPRHEMVVRTAQSDSLLSPILYLLGGLAILVALCIHYSRKVKKMMNIKVDIPLGLIGIDESKKTENNCKDSEKVRSVDNVSSTKDSIKIARTANEEQSTVPSQRKLDETSNSPIPAQLSASSDNLQRLRKTLNMAPDNLYILPEQMVLSVAEKPTENHFSAISTTSSGYVDLNEIASKTSKVVT